MVEYMKSCFKAKALKTPAALREKSINANIRVYRILGIWAKTFLSFCLRSSNIKTNTLATKKWGGCQKQEHFARPSLRVTCCWESWVENACVRILWARSSAPDKICIRAREHPRALLSSYCTRRAKTIQMFACAKASAKHPREFSFAFIRSNLSEIRTHAKVLFLLLCVSRVSFLPRVVARNLHLIRREDIQTRQVCV